MFRQLAKRDALAKLCYAAVATLDTPFANDPPTLADLEVMRAKLNEVILALRR